MRISDCSSDVCSSDLEPAATRDRVEPGGAVLDGAPGRIDPCALDEARRRRAGFPHEGAGEGPHAHAGAFREAFDPEVRSGSFQDMRLQAGDRRARRALRRELRAELTFESGRAAGWESGGQAGLISVVAGPR